MSERNPVRRLISVAVLISLALAISWLTSNTLREAKGGVVIAAGDIASCTSDDDEATARLLAGLEGTVVVLGDAAYPDGSVTDFANCYNPP